jgi:hypothetical protein
MAALIQPGDWKPQTCVGDDRDKAEKASKGKPLDADFQLWNQAASAALLVL